MGDRRSEPPILAERAVRLAGAYGRVLVAGVYLIAGLS